MAKVSVSRKTVEESMEGCVPGIYYLICPHCKNLTIAGIPSSHESKGSCICIHCGEAIEIRIPTIDLPLL